MIRIAVLVSGNGTNLQALIDAQKTGCLRHGTVVLVLSDIQHVPALKRAKDSNICAIAIDRRTLGREQFEKAALEILSRHCIDLVVLSGFITILSDHFIRSYAERIINIHPSLIPSFCGKGYYGRRVHEAVLARGVKVSGATVHLATSVADDGPILEQGVVRVEDGDTPETLGKRILEQVEWHILPEAVEEYCVKLEEKQALKEVLGPIRYPGRGIIFGRNENGNTLLAYFITARSSHSKNRMLVETQGEVSTQAIDPSLVVDPSLIIYRAMSRYEDHLIVANGDQSDTLIEGYTKNKSIESSLSGRSYEPDGPNYTPRISAVYSLVDGSCTMSILRKDREDCQRCHTRYAEPLPGQGYLIHTYEGDGDPLPSFIGAPRTVKVEGDKETFAAHLWALLDREYRVALAVKEVYHDKSVHTKIINREERRN